MSAPTRRGEFTFAAYLTFAASSNVKHEYLGGQLYAMAGGTPEHGALAAAFIGILHALPRAGRCRSLLSASWSLPSITPSAASTGESWQSAQSLRRS